MFCDLLHAQCVDKTMDTLIQTSHEYMCWNDLNLVFFCHGFRPNCNIIIIIIGSSKAKPEKETVVDE